MLLIAALPTALLSLVALAEPVELGALCNAVIKFCTVVKMTLVDAGRHGEGIASSRVYLLNVTCTPPSYAIA